MAKESRMPWKENRKGKMEERKMYLRNQEFSGERRERACLDNPRQVVHRIPYVPRARRWKSSVKNVIQSCSDARCLGMAKNGDPKG